MNLQLMMFSVRSEEPALTADVLITGINETIPTFVPTTLLFNPLVA